MESKIGHIFGTVWPIFAKFGTMTHVGVPNRTRSWNFQLLKIQDGGRPPSWKWKSAISIIAKACSCQKCHTPSWQKYDKEMKTFCSNYRQITGLAIAVSFKPTDSILFESHDKSSLMNFARGTLWTTTWKSYCDHRLRDVTSPYL